MLPRMTGTINRFSIPITLLRASVGTYDSDTGDYIESARENVYIRAVVQPASGEELNLVPEADRETSVITVWSNSIIFSSNKQAQRPPDLVLYQGGKYKVVNVWDRSINGFYRAIATLINDVR